jgi:hypothetical protein
VRWAVLLLLLGCDAGEEGRPPPSPPLGFTTGQTTGEETTTGAGATTGAEETTGDTSSTSDPTTTTTATTTSTSDITSSTSGDTTGETSGSTADDPTTGDTTGEEATTGDDATGEATTGELPITCPCTPEVKANQNVCAQEPTPDCAATLPGGVCDPNGDGSYQDADWIAGYHAYLAACG